jgi:hypothetical protein
MYQLLNDQAKSESGTKKSPNFVAQAVEKSGLAAGKFIWFLLRRAWFLLRKIWLLLRPALILLRWIWISLSLDRGARDQDIVVAIIFR